MGVRTPSVGLGLAAETGAEARAVIALIAVALIARGATTAYHHVFIAFEAGREQLQLVALFRSLEVAAAAGALALGAGVVWVATIHAASWTLEAAAALARKRARLGRARPAPTAREVATAAPGLLGAGLAVAAGQWLLLGPLALARVAAPDLEAAGHFTLAWSAAVTLSLMLGAGLAAALPVLGRSHARADGKELLYLDACLRGGMLLAAAAGIGAGALGETVIRLAVGPGYGPAGGAFAAALPIAGSILAGQALDQVLFLRGRTRLILALNLGGAAAVAAAFAAAFGSFGAVGGALASMAVLGGLALVKAWVAAGRGAAAPLLRAGAAGAAGITAFALLQYAGTWVSLAGGLATLAAAALATGAVSRSDPRRIRA